MKAEPKKSISTQELSFFWAAAILFQYISQLSWIIALVGAPLSAASALQFALVFSATALLLFPASSCLLMATAAFQISHVLLSLPDVPNHRLYTALVNLAILLGALKNRKAPWEEAAPVLRTLLVTLYLFAALAKTNSAYIDPSVSCATQFLHEMPLWNTSSPLLASAVAWGSLSLEWIVPLLLITRAFRPFAILLGLVFHIAISLDLARHFIDFSSVAVASLLAFSAVPILSAELRRSLGLAIAFGFTVCAYLGATAQHDWNFYLYFTESRDLLWLLYAGLVTGCYVLALPNWKRATLTQPFAIGTALKTLPFTLAILNGLTPYLGLKTKSSWDMYSNIRLEGSLPNHILGTLDLRGEMHFPVHILKSTNSLLQLQYAEAGYDITPFELSSIFSSDPTGVTSFEWKGVTYQNYLHGSNALPELSPPTWLDRKLTWYRPIDRSTPVRCSR